MSVGVVNDQKIKELSGSLRGRILRPGDDVYDTARAIWNGMIDKRPAVIAQCADARDVMAVVTFARENDLPAAVKGGGHNVAGNALCEDGVVIDLSLLKQVKVDPQARIAKAGGGVTWGEFDRATQEYGLATNGGLVSTTGIGGFTLGGGIGWLMRKYGLTCDNLISAEVVTAEGKLLQASADENPDLFWALRGGGGNFGVVTEFTYRLHPVGPTIYGGLIVWPFAEAEKILTFYRDYTEHLPEELTTMAAPVTAPPAPFVPLEMQGKLSVGVVGCYAGSAEDGKRAIAPLREFAPPAVDLFEEMPYLALQTMLDPISPAGMRNYWKSDYLPELSEEAIEIIVERFAEVPSPMTHIDIHDLGGAVRRVGEDATAFSHRESPYLYNIVCAWTDPADDNRNISWTRELWSSLLPYSSGATYVNFMGVESEQRVKAVYGPKYDKLAEIKRKYDPTNFFRLNQNIKPAA